MDWSEALGSHGILPSPLRHSFSASDERVAALDVVLQGRQKGNLGFVAQKSALNVCVVNRTGSLRRLTSAATGLTKGLQEPVEEDLGLTFFAAGKTLGSEFAKRVEWSVMSRNKSKLAITRMFTNLAVLTAIGGMAVCSLLPAQAQPIMDPAIANFQAEVTNPFMIIQTKAPEQWVTLPRNEDLSQGSSFVLLKDQPQVDKPSGLPDIHVGYGQCFPAQILVSHSTSLIEPPSRLYLKVSFTF